MKKSVIVLASFAVVLFLIATSSQVVNQLSLSENGFLSSMGAVLESLGINLRISSFPSTRFVVGEILLKFKVGANAAEVAKLIGETNLKVKKEIPRIEVKIIRVPAGKEEQLVQNLARNPNVEFAELNYIGQGALVPNDRYYNRQWHLPKISAPAGWDINIGSNSVIIAVIDSGVDGNHPDLTNKIVAGYNWLANNTDTRDVYGHGTAVAGTAAASSNNRTGVASVAWQNLIMPLVVLDQNNNATVADTAEAIIYAADKGAKVINLSLGWGTYSATLENAVNYAWNKGSLTVAAAHNQNISLPHWPAAVPVALAVAATDQNDSKANFSNYGNWIDIAAPGIDILTTVRGGGYGNWWGTSFATPIVSGLAGLIWSEDPGLTNNQVRNIIINNADDLGTAGFDQYFGWGRINVQKALAAASQAAISENDTVPPETSITAPADGSTLPPQGSFTVSATASDNVGVSQINLFFDAKLINSCSNTTSCLTSMNAKKVTAGTHNVTVRAYDSAGNQATDTNIVTKSAGRNR